ncbi:MULTISPECIES: hemin uptake protein HemP [Microvirga]|uniref:hemin uptake protein HemP n=1 Tax=Microvirga TaxID=186650 RepID=UPI001CFE112F|nr:hemin uptake protein HemP [Microvirga lenta]MCB5174510.1 hemin uptake protein HemP [Microvirga lenta]
MQKAPPSPDRAGTSSTVAKEIDVMTLIGTGREVVLLHRGERYRLRVTANGKLILTK